MPKNIDITAFEASVSDIIFDMPLCVSTKKDDDLYGVEISKAGWIKEGGKDIWYESLLKKGGTYVKCSAKAEISGISAAGSVFKECIVSKSTVKSYRGKKKQYANWTNITIDGGDWSESEFVNVFLGRSRIKTNLNKTYFSGCSLQMADLRGCRGAVTFDASAGPERKTDLLGCGMDVELALESSFKGATGLGAMNIYSGDKLVTGWDIDHEGKLCVVPDEPRQTQARGPLAKGVRTFFDFVARKTAPKPGTTISLVEVLKQKGYSFGIRPVEPRNS